MLKDSPCRVIQILTSAATGRYTYRGVDILTEYIHEATSFVSNPSPNVAVQTMLRPRLFQYHAVVITQNSLTCMNETGDVVVENMRVMDGSGLWTRLATACEWDIDTVRVLAVHFQNHKIGVDMKIVQRSRRFGDRPATAGTASA